MIESGSLTHRVRIERRAAVSDEYGNVNAGPWGPVITCFAAIRHERGREMLEAGRLESTTRGIVTVRRSEATAAIRPSDRLFFVSGPFASRTANIRSIVPSHGSEGFDIVFEEGVAT